MSKTSAAAAPPPRKVVLNVGGQRFETSEATLSKVPRSFFTRLLSGAVQVARDDDGAYFIDREGRFFFDILAWLRAFNPSEPLQRSTNLLVSFRNSQYDRVSEITGLPFDVYANAKTNRSMIKEAEFYGLMPLLFALDPTHPSVSSYNPAVQRRSKEDVEKAVRDWEGETNVPDLTILKLFQVSLTAPQLASQADAVAAAAQEAEQAVSDFDELGGFAALLDGAKASLLSKNGEVTWVPPAGFDIHKHGDAIAAEARRRYGLSIDILDNQLQLQPIV